MTALPFGIRDVRLSPLDSGGVVGTGIDLPNSRKLTFEEAEDFSELRGDDHLVTKRGSGPSVSWELEAGGLTVEALVVINGGVVTSTGTGATTKKTYKKKVTDSRPHFRAEGQSIAEGGGDVHVILYNCLADGGVSGEFSDGNFFLTSASGTAFASILPADAGALYDFIDNATAAAITP